MDSNLNASATIPDNRLVDIHGLLDALFGPTNRPSPRWIQYQMARRTIPYFRVGRLIRFDPTLVRAALNTGCMVCAKAGQRTAKAKCVTTTTTAKAA